MLHAMLNYVISYRLLLLPQNLRILVQVKRIMLRSGLGRNENASRSQELFGLVIEETVAIPIWIIKGAEMGHCRGRCLYSV